MLLIPQIALGHDEMALSFIINNRCQSYNIHYFHCKIAQFRKLKSIEEGHDSMFLCVIRTKVNKLQEEDLF